MKRLIIFLVLFVLGTATYIYYFFKADIITAWEIRYYVFVLTSVLFVFTFAVLRLYNAVVVNSKFLAELNTTIKTGLIPKLKSLSTSMDRPNKILNTTLQRTKDALSTLKDSVDSLVKVILRK